MSVQLLTIRLLGLRVIVSMDRSRHRQVNHPRAVDPMQRVEPRLAHHYPSLIWEATTWMTMRR